MAKIVLKHKENDENNFNKMRREFLENTKIFQFVYSYFYPEIYSFVEKWGIDFKKEFHLKFKTWKNKKNPSQKIAPQFELRKEESPPPGAEQKRLITNSDFDEEKRIADERKQKELKEKKLRKQERRRQVASKNKKLRTVG